MKKELLALLAAGKSLVEAAKELKITEDAAKKMLAPEPPSVGELVAEITTKVTENVTAALKALIPAPAAAAAVVDPATAITIPAGNNPTGTAAPTIMRGKTIEEKNLEPSWREIHQLVRLGKQGDRVDLDIDSSPADCAQMGMVLREKGMQNRRIMKTGLDGAAGAGYEWIPQDFASSLYTRLQGNAVVAPLIKQSVMTRASQTIGELTTPITIYGSPVTGSSDYPTANAYVGASNDKPTTAVLTIYAHRIVAYADIYDDQASDSLFNMLQEIQINAARMGGLALDSMIINGDNTATHMDNASATLWSTNAPELMCKGLRKYALTSGLYQSLATGNITVQNMGLVKKLAGKYARINPDQFVWIFGGQALGQLESLSDFTALYAAGMLWTQNQGYGPARLLGHKVVYSVGVPENLNASGVYDNSTTTKGVVLGFNTQEFVVGVRRQMSFEVMRRADLAKNVLLMTLRAGFSPFETPAAIGTGQGISTVVCGYNFNS